MILAVAGGAALYLQPWVTALPVVAVETLALAPVSRVLAVNGRIAGVQSVDLHPQVSGRLTEVRVADGDAVRLGAVLAQIDPATQQAVLRQSLAGLDAALVAEAEAQATLARSAALGSNVARVTLETATRTAQTATQEVARMTALLEQAQIALTRFTLRAPLSGTVLGLEVEAGQTVDPADTLMTIVDLGRLVVETDVDESYATQIRLGQLAVLQLSGETALRGARVSYVSQQVDESTGGLAIRLTPDTALVAPIGLTVTANITVDARAAAITVPRAALRRDASGIAVFVLENGLAQPRAVAVIDWPAARLMVTEGLAVGDQVITDVTGLADGQKVTVAR